MTLSPPRFWRPFPWATTKVRISDDARRCVAFLGDCDYSGDPTSFKPFATAFFVRVTSFADWVYLVTARHCVQERHPFWFRFNHRGSVLLQLIEEPDWIFHEDPTVDVAMMEFPNFGDKMNAVFYSAWSDYEYAYDRRDTWPSYGPGDLTYTVGLFDYHHGQSKNIPLVQEAARKLPWPSLKYKKSCSPCSMISPWGFSS